MSIDQTIKTAIEEALSYKVLCPYPCYANRADASRVLGISPQTLDKMFQDGTLALQKHTTQFVKGGKMMYYLPQILKDLKPHGATVMIFGKGD
jgi:hypothetical protein